jgi:hypothetical protein
MPAKTEHYYFLKIPVDLNYLICLNSGPKKNTYNGSQRLCAGSTVD